jgi:phospholipase C
VPSIIVSPWTVGGWVSSEVADHTSQLRFLEAVTGVKEPNISKWRRSHLGDMTSAFRFNDVHKKAPALPETIGRYNLAQYEVSQLPKPTFPTSQTMPRQEPGTRPHIS